MIIFTYFITAENDTFRPQILETFFFILFKKLLQGRKRFLTAPIIVFFSPSETSGAGTRR
jgi:hypothetical protein